MSDPVIAAPVATASPSTPATTPAAPSADAAAPAAVTPETPAAVPAPKPRQSDAIAAMKREEARVRKDREAVKAERERLEVDRRLNAEALNKAKTLDELDALLKQDPKAFIQKIGLNFNDLATSVFKEGTPEEMVERKVSERLAAYEAKQREAEEALKREAATRTKQENDDKTQREIAGAKQHLRQLTEADAAKYPFLMADDDSATYVFETMLEVFNRNGQKLPPGITERTVMDAVEADLRAQYEALQAKVAKTQTQPNTKQEDSTQQAPSQKRKKPSRLTLPSEPVADTQATAAPKAKPRNPYKALQEDLRQLRTGDNS